MNGLKNVRHRRNDAMSRLGWEQLESLLATYYRGQGYSVEHCGTGATGARFDGGIDLKLRREGEYLLVQCKHWNAKQVPHNEVTQLLGLMFNEGATGAILVTSGEFTHAAQKAAAKLGRVRLIDGDELRRMIGSLPEYTAVASGKVILPESGGTAQQGAKIAAKVGERLLSAVKGRIRYGRGGARTATRSIMAAAIAKVLLTLLFLAFVLAMFQILKHSILEIAHAPAQAPAARPASRPMQASATPVTAPAKETALAPSQRAAGNPCHEVIDWQSGTYIDHCAQGMPRQKFSEAERRELQRKADEAIKVIEHSTPEM